MFTEVSLSPPKRGEGKGEGLVIFQKKTKLLIPALSLFSEEREKIQRLIRPFSVKRIIPLSIR